MKEGNNKGNFFLSRYWAIMILFGIGLHHNKNIHLNKFLDFVEKEKIYDILVPSGPNTRKYAGFKVSIADPRLNDSIRDSLRKCTRTHISTVDKKAVR